MITPVAELAQRQLLSYNKTDIDGFCACYADDVIVLDETGNVSLKGIETFRERYHKLFSTFKEIHADVMTRTSLGRHCIDFERWQRKNPENGKLESGEVLVRYTEKNGKIGIVEFFHP